VSLMARVECLPIGSIPHASKLFTDYLSDFARVSDFYGADPFSALNAPKDFPADRRQRVADLLAKQNRAWGASESALANIEKLRAGAPAIVTGQQVALFGGPLFTILKAVTAIKLARQHGAVPVFWLATEDHDLAEVSSADLLAPGGEIRRITLAPAAHAEAAPVGGIVLGAQVREAVVTASELLGESGSEVAQLLAACYTPEATFGNAYARLFARLFAEQGLVIMDAAAPEFHQLAAPLLRDSLSRADELSQALLARNAELEKRGYAAQVKVARTSTLLFDMRSGARRPISLANGGFSVAGEKSSREELVKALEAAPGHFSPGALFRPVMQDFLLPTLAYIGGPAEVAYFAQSQVIYKMLLGRVTPILPRISATLIDAGAARKLGKYRLQPVEAFRSAQEFHQLLATRALPQSLDSEFERAQFDLGEALSRLGGSLEKLDPTLVEASQRAASKISYQLSRLQTRAGNAQARRNGEVARHAAQLATLLYPHGGLQERGISAISFLARHGNGLVHELERELRPDCAGHQLLWM